ncbi:uncharacterized protein ankrd24 isoform X1 [Paramormyrops kingsleyae]|uniref:uncharacterized protein ankrd24 isoform X1 n=2 Tax=Paramormyrops kingsleyae TaxID=1676925 RepID=UPI003B96F228
MKSLKAKFKKTESQDWSKSDERLLQAVEQNDLEKVAALLVKKGLCASKLDGEGKSAFHVCAAQGRLDCLEIILSHNVDVIATDSAGSNALHLAAKNGHSECVKRLLQERVSVDSTDCFGRTALHHAVVCGCLSCTEILWDFKACLDAQDGDGATPLLLGAQMSRVELCAFLLDRGAMANLQDNQGRTALMLACESDSVETVEVLLRGGANPLQTDALGHSAAHYSVVSGNRYITRLLQDAAKEGAGEEPPPPPPLPGRSTPRKRKAPPPPSSPSQGSSTSPEPQRPSPAAQSPDIQRPPQASLTEDEEVFEEIRRLRLERGRLLQKIKGLEQQQHSAHSALEELCLLRERLGQAEADRERLTAEMEELRGLQAASDSEDMEDMLDFPGADRLLSRRSRASDPESEPGQADAASHGESESSSGPRSRKDLEALVEKLTAQNTELVLKVKMLETFEKDDTDMQSSGPDFVPTVLYDSLRKEFDELQERYSQAQAVAEASSVTGEQGCIQEMEGEQGEAESAGKLKEKLKEMEQRLAETQTELEELKEQVQVGVFSVELSEGQHPGMQHLMERVKELEEALAEKQREEDATMTRLSERVHELESTLEQREAQGESEGGGDREQEGEVVRRLQGKVEELQADLQECVPRVELEEMQLTMGLQLEQLASERAEASLRLNDALLELEKLRPPPQGDGEDDEDEEEHSEGSDPSITSDRSVQMSAGSTLAAVREELEVARQEAAQALDCLCAEREGRAQDALQMKDAVPLSQHQEALSALTSQLEEVAQELEAERHKHGHTQQEVSRLEAELQTTKRDFISKEEHEKVKTALERSLQDSESSVQAAQDVLSEKEAELKELRSQRAAERGMVSKEDHEAQRVSLQAEINALGAQMVELTRKHEKTCTEVFQVQREALFNKSERQAAEEQLVATQKQLVDLQAQSSHVQELHKGIQDSQGLIKEKDRKITELSKEIFRLKEALGALSPPLGLSSSGSSSQQVALQNHVTVLTQQLQEWEQKHRAVVSVYRAHLLSAVQGRMDGEVQALLLEILRMSQKEQG